jgi:hypothetical protein
LPRKTSRVAHHRIRRYFMLMSSDWRQTGIFFFATFAHLSDLCG